jgi:Methyltransferase domain
VIAHFYQDVPGWFNFEDVYRMAVDRAANGAHFVEVGTFCGKSAAFLAVEIANSGKRIAFDTCDAWHPVTVEDAGGAMFETQQRLLREHGSLMAIAAHFLAPVPGIVALWSADSLSFANRYEDESLDLVYLDDDHTYAHVLQELRAWWPKVRPGGIFAGHDMQFADVRRAVSQWAAERQVAVTVIGSSWAVGLDDGVLVRGRVTEIYPAACYHDNGQSCVVTSRREEAALGEGWTGPHGRCGAKTKPLVVNELEEASQAPADAQPSVVPTPKRKPGRPRKVAA